MTHYYGYKISVVCLNSHSFSGIRSFDGIISS